MLFTKKKGEMYKIFVLDIIPCNFTYTAKLLLVVNSTFTCMVTAIMYSSAGYQYHKYK